MDAGFVSQLRTWPATAEDVNDLTTDRLNAEHGVLKIKPDGSGP